MKPKRTYILILESPREALREALLALLARRLAAREEDGEG